jgi:putative cardiolipin synthase
MVAVLFLAGCTSMPKNYPKAPSTAFKEYKSTSMGKMFDREAAKHPGKSGFDIIRYGRRAFTARIAMTEVAEKSLDLQYYIWEPDETGRLLAYYVLKAADRGVKVRILLDDIGLEVRDTIIASFDAHPNIEIRIFNPFSVRRSHGLNFLIDFDRVNHRMHNKTFVMDNSLVIIGGRNIGNHYFGVDDHMNFRDLDVLGAGPIVREVSTVYDYFWNGEWSVPVKALADKTYTQEELKNARALMEQKIAKDHYPYSLTSDVKKLRSQMRAVRKNLVWAKGKFVWDDPKQMRLSEDQQHGTMIEKLHKKLTTLNKSLYIESPYFIPRKKGTAALKEMYKRGVKIRILTNSQSSNDVLAAFAGYDTYRKELVESGIQMYELRPDAGGNLIINKKTKLAKVASGLHAKALVFDEKTLFVGSFNLDPRSSAINTEGGLYVESPKLAKRVLDYMNEGVKPENAYRVTLDKNGDLVWTAETDGKQEVYHRDPHTSGWDRFKADLIQAMPIEDQL